MPNKYHDSDTINNTIMRFVARQTPLVDIGQAPQRVAYACKVMAKYRALSLLSSPPCHKYRERRRLLRQQVAQENKRQRLLRWIQRYNQRNFGNYRIGFCAYPSMRQLFRIVVGNVGEWCSRGKVWVFVNDRHWRVEGRRVSGMNCLSVGYSYCIHLDLILATCTRGGSLLGTRRPALANCVLFYKRAADWIVLGGDRDRG